MTLPTCTLSMLIARTDIPYMMHTIPHLVRACRFPFTQRILYLDSSPLRKIFQNRPGVGTLAELRDCCDRLIKDNVIDKVIDIDFSDKYRKEICKKYFGKPLKHTYDYRGSVIWGYIFAIERAETDYLLYFDCDMLLYQNPKHNWINQGIQLLQNYQDIMCVLPLSGPPHKDGVLFQKYPYEQDERGFYKFRRFTTRKFLIDRKRFEKFLPIRPLYQSWRDGLKKTLKGESTLKMLEGMIANRLLETSYIRADLSSPDAWTVHPLKHDQAFVDSLPQLIEKIESGWYPAEQAGHYDLKQEFWF